MKPMHLWIDQYGDRIWARTAKELRERAGGGRLFKIYRDKKSGPPVHVGYGVGRRWFSRFAPVQVPISSPEPVIPEGDDYWEGRGPGKD